MSVSPKVGKPVSFLVKAKKLGEMMVRVKASIANGIHESMLVSADVFAGRCH